MSFLALAAAVLVLRWARKRFALSLRGLLFVVAVGMLLGSSGAAVASLGTLVVGAGWLLWGLVTGAVFLLKVVACLVVVPLALLLGAVAALV
ncbi:hypothetical protein [Wenjunlia tyrosinilytica]|uniref:Uncharacterized protein n=1 Tax=Wenjunlia tyrosinilytica TaxID=1544741 RepID=A0A918E244_9ACTN|nr:hypothetical protein [Wenjunlia tyrosinilytica]GGO98168.1 hypothetical protein GCM10012280_61670 [Wenjunlia tyrosinilytica]